MKPSFEIYDISQPAERHLERNRTFQGIPGVVVLPNGRIFALWYAGSRGEGPDNFVTLCLSDDKGGTWSDSIAVVDPEHPNVRAYDANLWFAPDGRLFMFWSQSTSHKLWDTFDGTAGVWYSILENYGDTPDNFHWSKPVRICDGIMMNKPTVLSDGTWTLPVSVWSWKGFKEESKADPEKIGAKVVITRDGGKSFFELGKTVVPADIACFDEHTIVELNDGRLWMIIRVEPGNAESFSDDKGKTWSVPVLSKITGPNSRLWIRRLKSGKLVLVNNKYDPPVENDGKWGVRKNLTAWLSDDEGRSWYGGLCLDEREQVSYPDGQQCEDGSIWVVYDHCRMRKGEILAAHITEEDIAAGEIVNPKSRLKVLISRTNGVPDEKEEKYHA